MFLLVTTSELWTFPNPPLDDATGTVHLIFNVLITIAIAQGALMLLFSVFKSIILKGTPVASPRTRCQSVREPRRVRASCRCSRGPQDIRNPYTRWCHLLLPPRLLPNVPPTHHPPGGFPQSSQAKASSVDPLDSSAPTVSVPAAPPSFLFQKMAPPSS